MKIKNYLLLLLILSALSVFSGTTTTYTISVNGTTRTFIVYVPTIYDGSKPVPLMLNIHGWSMSDAQQQNMINYDPVADTANFITARPRGLNNAWSQATTVSAGQADRDFIWQMIDTLKSWYNINPCRVYCSGFSQGSFMSQISVINVDNPTRAPVIAAIGSSSGGISKSGNPSYWTAKNPTHPVPVLHLHGTSDGTISYDGGGTQNPASVDELMNFWVTHNNCNTTPTMTTCGSIDHYIWDGGDRGTRVELYKVNGGSHSAPNNTCMNSAKTIWEFCSQFCLPYLTSTTCTENPTISAQTGNTSICSGSSTTFEVTASGCVGTALTYQWQVNTGSGFSNLTNTAPYSGVTTSTLTVTSATTGLNNYQYRCYVSSCCENSYSANATLTVTNCCNAPTITGTTPASRCDAGTVTLGATSSAGTINWYDAPTGGTSLGTGISYTIPSISATTTFYVDATDNSCTTTSRTAITATVSNSPTATISGDATVCQGGSSIISIALTGTGPWSVTYGSATGSTPVSNITASTYTVSVAAGTYTLSAVSDASTCTGTFSGSATITENTPITVSTATLTCDGSNANYTVEFDISGGDAATYTVDGSAANIVSGHYTSSAITSGSSYSLTVTDSYNCSPVIVSGSKTCASNCNATAAISGDATICAGTSAIVSIDLTGTAPWSVTYAIDGSNQTPVTTSSATYTFSTSTTGAYSLVSVTDANSCTATNSGTATITERTPITTSTATVTCDGANANYTVEFDISGGDATSYTVDGSAANIAASHFTSSAITSGSSYSFTVNDANNCAPVVVSGTKTCGVTCNATATMSGDATICSGSSTTISIALTGTAPWSVTYAVGGINQTPITTSSATVTIIASTAGAYTLASVSDGNSCTATTSGSATIVENTAISISNKTETCNGGNTDYIVEFDISGGDAASYTVDGSAANITSAHYTSSTIASGVSYSFTVNDANNCSPVTVSGTKTCSSPPVCNATASISGNTTICAGATATISIALTGTVPWSVTYAVDGTNQTPVTATSSPYTFTTGTAGVYTLVSVTDANSCVATNTGSATIIVNALPAVTTVANPSSAAICVGNTVTLSGAGAVNYSWSGGISDGVAFLPSVGSTTYTVTGTDLNNCSNTDTRVVTAYALPTVGITASPASASVCAGATVILIGTGAASYSWSTGATTTAITLVPTITETITVTGTDANSCTNTSTKVVTVGDCNPGTGIEEGATSQSFSVYPNPTDGTINITISNANGTELIITVMNVFGAEVYSSIEKNIPSDHTKQINLGDLADGMYYIQLKIGADTQVKKLVIQ